MCSCHCQNITSLLPSTERPPDRSRRYLRQAASGKGPSPETPRQWQSSATPSTPNRIHATHPSELRTSAPPSQFHQAVGALYRCLRNRSVPRWYRTCVPLTKRGCRRSSAQAHPSSLLVVGASGNYRQNQNGTEMMTEMLVFHARGRR